MRLGKTACQGILLSWHSDEMDMIVHQTPGPDINAMVTAGLPQERKVGSTIFGTEEDIHAPVPTLDDVVRIAGDHNSC
jgi:hypothetical protein